MGNIIVCQHCESPANVRYTITLPKEVSVESKKTADTYLLGGHNAVSHLFDKRVEYCVYRCRYHLLEDHIVNPEECEINVAHGKFGVSQ